MTTDSVCAIHSMTKAVTAAAAMQLVEQGRLSLDAPAGEVCPYLHEVQVFDGYAQDGSPVLRPPSSPVTLRHLLTHTSGFVYDLWNEAFRDYAAQAGIPPLLSLQRAALEAPLMFDPGTEGEYGIGIDWAGLMIEAATGQTLGAYFADHLTGPLGMHDTGFTPTASMGERMSVLYHRQADGSLQLPPSDDAPDDLPEPEFEMGGGGLLSTARDYSRFMRMILNGGELDGVRVLAADTIEQMAANQMGDLRVRLLKTAEPLLSNDAEFFPGSPKSWGLSFQINEQAESTGRAAGTLMWAGLSNCYFWIDRSSDVAGLMLTQLFPFADQQSLDLLHAIETAVYAART
jgi:methyl acetate hydrolase